MASDVERQAPPTTPPEDDQPEAVYIGPWAYLRAMWSIAWSAFRHPFKTTYIDASTGRVIRHE
jgi:hypothetical protein